MLELEQDGSTLPGEFAGPFSSRAQANPQRLSPDLVDGTDRPVVLLSFEVLHVDRPGPFPRVKGDLSDATLHATIPNRDLVALKGVGRRVSFHDLRGCRLPIRFGTDHLP